MCQGSYKLVNVETILARGLFLDARYEPHEPADWTWGWYAQAQRLSAQILLAQSDLRYQS